MSKKVKHALIRRVALMFMVLLTTLVLDVMIAVFVKDLTLFIWCELFVFSLCVAIINLCRTQPL
jgi:hypothetical protein